MHSLRFRLTVAYAVPIAFALCIAFGAVTYLCLEFLARPVVEAIATSAARARTIAAADRTSPTEALLTRIAQEAATPGARVLIRPRRIILLKIGPGPARGPFAPPPLGGPGSGGPPPYGPLPRFIAETNLALLLAIHPTIVNVRDAEVAILPDLHRLDQSVAWYLEALGVAIFFSLIGSWLIARWITAHAIAPLGKVTEELRRFAAGDFSPGTVTTKDRSELGALIEAYNGAAAQVSDAFRERERVEHHMRRFVADAGHELRTPLTAIRGFIEILERGGAQKSGVRERAFQTLNKETQRMSALVEQLITLSRFESLEHVVPGDVDLRESVAAAIDSALAARPGRIVLRRADEARVWGDPAGVYEAIVNLLDNALKYGAGSAVAVEIVRTGGTAAVRIADGGPGIPENERKHIFERFFRGDGRSGIEGSGLGLAIAARAAELAGGSVVLESAEPGNTAFVLTLPVPKVPAPSERYTVSATDGVIRKGMG
jgi:signal transduction histidine kinase